MGMEQSVIFGQPAIPSWPAVRDLLAGLAFPVQMRMIDGQLVLPTEEPPAVWRELRVGTALGMITLRRESDRVRVVTWGNADPGMRQAWNALAWAFAEAGAGRIETSEGPLTAAEFRQS